MRLSLIGVLIHVILCHGFVPQTLDQSRSSAWHMTQKDSDARDDSQTNNSLKSTITLENEATLEFEIHTSISAIRSNDWNACLIQGSSAFLDYSWIHCLEESKCASPQTGWVPQHVSIKINGEISGFIPLYIKGHSMGEFIFDSSWADAAYQNKIDYYPKLLVAVPFTPATGARILWHPSVYQTYKASDVMQLRRAAAMFLRQIAATNQISSVHINFLTEKEATDIAGPLSLPSEKSEQRGVKKKLKSLLELLSIKDDYIRRSSIQYHWTNSNPKNNGTAYESFDDYLNCFKSKRRINIRRERRYVADQGIRINVVRGREILGYPGLMERMFAIYQSTIQKMYWGRQYLTLEFFEMLAKSDFVDNLCFVCARYNTTSDQFRAEDVFAGTFNVVKDGVFYGRYWGCLGDEVKNLHFETCYWSAIEYCIENGVKRMEPGAGGGDYKWARGFDPVLINSVHYVAVPSLRRAISQFVEQETEHNVEMAEYLESRRVTAKALDQAA